MAPVNTTADRELRVINSVPGRIRIQIPDRLGHILDGIEWRLRYAPGVLHAGANPLTGTIVIHFDPMVIDQTGVLRAIHSLTSIPVPESDMQPAPVRLQWQSQARVERAPDPKLGPGLKGAFPLLDVADFVLRVAGILLGILYAESLVGLALSCLEALRLIAGGWSRYARAVVPAVPVLT